MSVEVIMKAAKQQALLADAVTLLQKRANCGKAHKAKLMRKKKAALVLVTHLAKQAKAGKMTKQALVGLIGAKLLRLLGRGMRGAGKGLSALGMGAAGQKVQRGGAKVMRTGGMAELGRRMRDLKGGAPVAAHMRSSLIEPLSTDERFQKVVGGLGAESPMLARLAQKAPAARSALGTAQLTGLGALGAGGLGAASLMGGDDEQLKPESKIPPELMMALQQLHGQGGAA